MSSRRTTARASTRASARPRTQKRAPGKAASKKTADRSSTRPCETPTNGPSAEAKRLAAAIERDLRDGRHDTLSPEAFQSLMAALCKSYGTQLEAGANFLPVPNRNTVSPTEIMTTTSGLLKAANLAVFELGMWQSWTGR